MSNNSHDQMTNIRQNFQKYYHELFSVIYNTDRELLEYAKHFHESVSSSHRVHFSSWSCPLSIQDDSLIRYRPYELFNLSPLQRHLEILRTEAEAWLIHNKLGYCDLAQWEKDAFIQRALGILPDNKEERFAEIITCPGFRPAVELQNFYHNIDSFKKGLQSIKKEFGQSTALPFGLLIQSGTKTRSDFEYYGQKFDLILRKITHLPQVQELLITKRIENSFSSQFIFLATLRDRLLKKMPHRIQDEKKFFLTDIIDVNWDTCHEIHGAELSFAALDSIILSKFGFENNCVIVDDNILLEVITAEKVIYWEPLTNAPITFYSPMVKYRSDFLFLIALTFVKIADVYVQLGRDFEKAIELYEKAINLIPDFPATYANLSQVYIKTNSPKQAITSLEKAIAINPEAAEYHHLMGLAYCLTHDWAPAITALKTAVSIRPSYIEALNNLAYAYEQAGDLNKAKDIYLQILSIKPNYFEANFGLGNVYFNYKQYQRAITHFERALKLKPNSQRVYYNLAQTYFEMGELDTSIKTYKELLRHNPNHAAAWYNLGIIYRNKGMKKEAVKCIEQAVRFNPNLMR
jgi:tetratricopeptide (TPR) repeat protein